ncbi:hypothetical protein [Candidatus Venteria ishoeyi]|uniref:Uncharacterized protein n=1 Tax=Candidatus Venteria ishoeyi TaxID=1899563 RepID=A0A1H6F941_9GAMM|nr:hypothetical protein [Candidatus Venteria ishoeyi]SEH06632.1 Uncharacterised protein [Candidatus Venteria ishoeyi]
MSNDNLYDPLNHINNLQQQDLVSGSDEHHSETYARSLSFHSDPTANPYTCIDDSNGFIYRHEQGESSGDWVGTIDHNSVYNTNRDYLGYGSDDGKIFDSHEHLIGWVDNQGHVFNSSGVEVSTTVHGVVGAAAYLLCVYQGNVP